MSSFSIYYFFYTVSHFSLLLRHDATPVKSREYFYPT